jgi:glucosyl-3-phosphoglycerate synthase
MAPNPPPGTLQGTPRAVQTSHHADFGIDALLAAKGGRGVSVVLPARNEESTIGPIVEKIVDRLAADAGLVDEVVVIDSASTDSTAEVAADFGAAVISADDVFPELGPARGKGDAMWRALSVTKGDVVTWIDADLLDFDTRMVTGILGPVLADRGVALSKGFYARPMVAEDGTVAETGGGRVTELVARPVLSMIFPELAGVVQPLSGEYAMRRDVAQQLPFPTGYGVEIGLLIDVCSRWGIGAIAQVDLESRLHRNRPLEELGRTAFEVMYTALSRAMPDAPLGDTFWKIPAGLSPYAVSADVDERPPLLDYRGRL